LFKLSARFCESYEHDLMQELRTICRAARFPPSARLETDPAEEAQWRHDMHKFLVSLAALAAFSTAAAAGSLGITKGLGDGSGNDGADFGSPPASTTADEAGFVIPNAGAVAIAETGDGWLFANGENVKDPKEVRRLDEKN
jgi:hypothetical protein